MPHVQELAWNCTFLIYVVKGSETYDVEGPTSIIQKVTTAMFGGRALNGPDCSEIWFVGC